MPDASQVLCPGCPLLGDAEPAALTVAPPVVDPSAALADIERILALEAEEVESVEFDGPMYEVVPIPKEVSSRYSNALAHLPACPVLAPTHA